MTTFYDQRVILSFSGGVDIICSISLLEQHKITCNRHSRCQESNIFVAVHEEADDLESFITTF
jgi:hypothetical protein